MKIAVSAGHDFRRKGACYDGVCEFDLTVPWQNSVLMFLGDYGLAVPNLVLPQKIAFINAHPETTIAVEIHFNAGGKNAHGCETLYAPNSRRGMRVAETVQRAMSSFCSPNRGIKEGWYRMDRPNHIDYKGDIEGDEVVDAFLSKTRPPAIIIEPFFMNELNKIRALQEPICQVIAEALIESANVLERR